MEQKSSRRSNNSEEQEAIELAKLHCASEKSEEGNLHEEEARKKLLWAVRQLEEEPNFRHIDIKRLIENTDWPPMSVKPEFKDPEY